MRTLVYTWLPASPPTPGGAGQLYIPMTPHVPHTHETPGSTLSEWLLLPFPTASATVTIIPAQAAATHWASALSPKCFHTLLIQP